MDCYTNIPREEKKKGNQTRLHNQDTNAPQLACGCVRAAVTAKNFSLSPPLPLPPPPLSSPQRNPFAFAFTVSKKKLPQHIPPPTPFSPFFFRPHSAPDEEEAERKNKRKNTTRTNKQNNSHFPPQYAHLHYQPPRPFYPVLRRARENQQNSVLQPSLFPSPPSQHTRTRTREGLCRG